MKTLEEATIDSGVELGKRVIQDGPKRGVVVIAFREGDAPAQVVVRSYKRARGWTLASYDVRAAESWRRLADAILELDPAGDNRG